MLAASILEDYQSDFCPKCGTLVDLDTNDSVISCQACKQKLPLEQFIGRPIKTSLRITTNK